MKVFNILFGLVFFLFAILQYNDPDPYLWIPIYVFSSIICILNSRDKFNLISHIALIAFCIVYAAILLLSKDGVISWVSEHETESLVQSMKATKPWIEQTREFGGLIIILIVSIVNVVALNKKSGI
ncbi:MAG: transmembrane 220 family protein [bacterium]|jgi:hypothetical protein